MNNKHNNSTQDQLDTTLIKSIDAFRELETEWNQLVLQENYDITLLHQWQITWWEIFKQERELYIITVRNNKKLIGIAPFLKRRVHYFKKIPINRIEFIASGEDERDEICSEYLDFICSQTDKEKTIKAITDLLITNKNEWDEILLTDIKHNSENLKAFTQNIALNNIKHEQKSEAQCPYIELTESWEDIKKRNRINSREQLNRKKRRLEKLGNIEYCTIESKDISKDIFNQYISLHQARWNTEGKNGSFSSELFHSFHLKLLERLKPLSAPVLYFLLLDNQAIAARYCFSFNNTLYDYLPGLDPSLDRKLSHGFINLAQSIEQSIESRHRRFDFFKGKPGSYKYKWTNTTQTISQHRFSQSRFLPTLVHILEVLKVTLKQLIPKKT